MTRFLAISDKFEEKSAKKKQETPKLLQEGIEKSKNVSSLMANQFIRNFVYEQTHEVNAIIIQRAFRSFLLKRHWKKFIHIRLRFNAKLKMLFFLNWRAAIADQPESQISIYNQFRNFQANIPWIAHGRELACFQYYYCTHQIYVTEGYSQEMIFDFLRLMFASNMVRIIRLWKLIAGSQKIHHSKLNFIRFTARRVSRFNPVYLSFEIWRRFVQWKKIARKTQFEDNTYIHLDFQEQIPFWNVIERRLNQKQRTLVVIQANLRKKLKEKVIKVLYNGSIDKQTQQQANAEADSFRQRQLSKLCCRAWLRYLEIQQRQKQMIRDCIQGWYEVAYGMGRKKIQINFFKKREIDFFLHKVLTRWNRSSILYKIESAYRCLRVQNDPSLGFLFCFGFKNFEITFQIMCWRGWLKYTRRRRAWKRFCQTTQSNDYDNEKTQIIMSELKRIGRAHAAGLSTENHEILPRGLGISPELQILNTQQILADIEEERVSHTAIPYDKNAARTPECLSRMFLVYISQKQNLDVFKKKPNIIDHFERFRTMQDLQEQIEHNSRIFHHNIRIKETKVRSIIASINAHAESAKFSKEFEFFTLKSEPLSTDNFPEFEYNTEIPFVFWEYEVSIKNITRQHQMAPPRLMNTFGNEMKAAFRKFDARLRSPYEIKKAKNKGNGLNAVFSGFFKANADIAKGISKNASLMKSFNINQNTFNNNSSNEFSYFQFKYVKLIVSHMTETELCIACVKVLAVVTGRTISADPTELLPNMEVSRKRKVLRNIKNFVTETGLTNISAPALGVHAGMKKDMKLSKYSGECAFIEFHKQDSSLSQELRVKLWRRIKAKYPNLDVPESLPGRDLVQHLSANINKVRIRSSTNLLTLPNDTRDELTSVEAYSGCFILPLVIDGDNLVLLLNDSER